MLMNIGFSLDLAVTINDDFYRYIYASEFDVAVSYAIHKFN